MSNEDLRQRTKTFALRVVRLYASLARRDDIQKVLGRQMLRSGTSVGAQYREACRARSTAEFVSKITSAMQELDETGYWFELLVEGGVVAPAKLASLRGEVDEMLAIFYASIRTARRKR